MEDRKNFNTTIKKDLLKRLRQFALDHEVRLNDVIEDAIEKYLNDRDRNEKKEK